jgi:hypothetical protein
MNRRQAVLAAVLLSVVGAALLGFGSAAVLDALTGTAQHQPSGVHQTSGHQTPGGDLSP